MPGMSGVEVVRATVCGATSIATALAGIQGFQVWALRHFSGLASKTSPVKVPFRFASASVLFTAQKHKKELRSAPPGLRQMLPYGAACPLRHQSLQPTIVHDPDRSCSRSRRQAVELGSNRMSAHARMEGLPQGRFFIRSIFRTSALEMRCHLHCTNSRDLEEPDAAF